MNLMTPAEIMDTAFEILRKNIKTIILYGIGFGMIALFAIIILLIIIGILGAGLSVGGSTTGSILVMIVLGSLFFSLLGGFYFAYGVGIIKISAHDILNAPVYAHELIKDALKSVGKVFKILLTAFVISLPVIGAVAAIGYISLPVLKNLYAVANSTSDGPQILVIILFLVLGLSASLAVVAYLTVFCFTLQAAFIEQKGALGSIKRSFKLVRNNFKPIYGYFILFLLTSAAINISLQGAISLLGGVIFLVMKLLNMSIDYMSFTASLYTYSRVPLNIINWLIISPISTIMLTILYFKQRCKLEGYDINLKIKELRAKKGEVT